MGFLDNIKDVPQNNGGNYMKLNQGPNQIRIVGAADDGGLIQGMIGWGTTAEGGRKPYRWKMGEDIPEHLVYRSNELNVSKAAHAIGVSPKLIHFEPGVMVYDYIQCKTLARFYEMESRKQV